MHYINFLYFVFLIPFRFVLFFFSLQFFKMFALFPAIKTYLTKLIKDVIGNFWEFIFLRLQILDRLIVNKIV